MALTTLDASYERCRALHRAHGTTYYWATSLLPRESRRHVHALYGFCRYADELVDAPHPDPARALADLGAQLFADLERGSSDHPVLAAVVDTVQALDIDVEQLDRFLRSMAMDLTVTRYETYDDLLGYMDGSAAVIGELMLPVLRPVDRARAFQPARDLGLAFQLTNFVRDVGEDLDRGRVYLPQEDLERFGADPWRRRVDGAWRALLAFELERCRELYRSADEGIALLPGRAGRCVRTARVLYSRILDVVERNDYDVFSTRARVATPRKLGVAARIGVLGTIGTRNP